MNEAEIKLSVFRIVDELQGDQLHEIYQKLLLWHQEQYRAFFLQKWAIFLQLIPIEVQEKYFREWAKAVPSPNAELEWKIGYGYRQEQKQLQLNLSVKVSFAQTLSEENLNISFLSLLEHFFSLSSIETLQAIEAKLDDLLENVEFELSGFPTLYLDSEIAVNHLILRAKLKNFTPN